MSILFLSTILLVLFCILVAAVCVNVYLATRDARSDAAKINSIEVGMLYMLKKDNPFLPEFARVTGIETNSYGMKWVRLTHSYSDELPLNEYATHYMKALEFVTKYVESDE